MCVFSRILSLCTAKSYAYSKRMFSSVLLLMSFTQASQYGCKVNKNLIEIYTFIINSYCSEKPRQPRPDEVLLFSVLSLFSYLISNIIRTSGKTSVCLIFAQFFNDKQSILSKAECWSKKNWYCLKYLCILYNLLTFISYKAT